VKNITSTYWILKTNVSFRFLQDPNEYLPDFRDALKTYASSFKTGNRGLVDDDLDGKQQQQQEASSSSSGIEIDIHLPL